MVQGMAGHREHLDLLFEQTYLEAVFERPVDAFDAVVRRAPDLAASRGLEGQYAAGMITVVMGEQDGAQLVLRMAAQPTDDRLGVARIDRRDLQRGFVQQQPDVVVLECWQGNELWHGHRTFLEW